VFVVIGTSLSAQVISAMSLVDSMKKGGSILVLVNKTRLNSSVMKRFDFFYQGSADSFAVQLKREINR
jgi:NAD-dependent SIR2 family protein deacetylase